MFRLRLIACGALAREFLEIIDRLPPDVNELSCLSAAWRNHLEKIVPDEKAKVKAIRKAGFTPVVI